MSSEGEYVPEFINYRTMRTEGSCFSFFFSLDDENLFTSKIQTKHQTDPIPIAKGGEVHYSQRKGNYALISSDNFHNFVLKRYGSEIMKVRFDLIDGKKGNPKKIEATWKPSNGSDWFTLVSKDPVKTEDGVWGLDFDGRYAKPSIKNAIMIDPKTKKVKVMIRRVEIWEVQVDAKKEIPPLFLFTLLMCLNVCPF